MDMDTGLDKVRQAAGFIRHIERYALEICTYVIFTFHTLTECYTGNCEYNKGKHYSVANAVSVEWDIFKMTVI